MDHKLDVSCTDIGNLSGVDALRHKEDGGHDEQFESDLIWALTY